MAHKLPTSGRILGLDIGDARIGLAAAHIIARIPAPLETLLNNVDLYAKLREIVAREDIGLLVVGIPRNMQGEETAQSAKIRAQAEDIAKELGIELVFADESLSSRRADDYLAQNKKSGATQDSLAACFILEEFIGGVES